MHMSGSHPGPGESACLGDPAAVKTSCCSFMRTSTQAKGKSSHPLQRVQGALLTSLVGSEPERSCSDWAPGPPLMPVPVAMFALLPTRDLESMNVASRTLL